MSPQGDLLLFEISALFFVNQHQIQEVAALESIVYVWICWREVRTSQIEPDWDALSLHWGAIHNLKFVQILRFRHSGLPWSNDLLSYYAQLHMLNLDPYQIEVDFTKYTVLQMELTLIELKFYVQALFNTNLHFDWSILIGLLSFVGYDEFFLLGYPIVIAIDDDVDVVAQPDHYSVISLELLFYSIELEIVWNILGQSSWWF